ncbi:MAG: hypothetical protein HQL22_08870 [Candidatus Omnitrophica bacterium]|nr:hypothetical protein [Candidatus Omnitrophota bacterium]
MVRMNIMMPEALAEYLKKVPNKSRFIAESLEERIRRERSRHLRASLAEAYMHSAEEDRAIDRSWIGTMGDGGWSE